MKFFRSTLALAVISSLANHTVSAQVERSKEQTKVITSSKIEETIVTGTMTEKSLFNFSGSADLVTQEDIAISQPQDLSDVFVNQPGMDIISTGGRGSTTSVLVRGTNSNQTLFLINGLRVSSATLGLTQFSFIDPQQISRIETVRGARSSLYGSDAMGGVISIQTHKDEPGFNGYATVQGGSYNTKLGSAGVSGKTGNVGYALGLSLTDSDGIDNTLDEEGLQSDKDGYKKASGNAYLGYSFTENTNLSLSHFQTDSESDYDGWFAPLAYSQAGQSATGLKFESQLTSNYRTLLTLGHAIDSSEQYDRDIPDVKLSFFETSRDSVFWQNDFSIEEIAVITVGLDAYEESVDSSSIYTENTRENKAIFSQAQIQILDADLVAGVREDNYSDNGSETTGSLALGYTINENLRLYGSWNQGFKAPTFNDLFWPVSDYSQGNPDLEPEESENIEAGVKVINDTFSTSIAVFNNQIDNLINWQDRGDGVWQPENINQVDIRGLELTASKQIGAWAISANYSYTDPRDAETREVINDRSRRKFVFDLKKVRDNYSYGVDFRWQDERKTSTGFINPYSLVNFYISYNIFDNLEAKIKINNLLDEDYVIREGYRTEGANGNVKLVYHF